jgi:hypothetical protein
MTNDELQLNVADELFWDPKVDNEAIAVSANGGTVSTRMTPPVPDPRPGSPSMSRPATAGSLR